jgi:hypothetical protein
MNIATIGTHAYAWRVDDSTGIVAGRNYLIFFLRQVRVFLLRVGNAPRFRQNFTSASVDRRRG